MADEAMQPSPSSPEEPEMGPVDAMLAPEPTGHSPEPEPTIAVLTVPRGGLIGGQLGAGDAAAIGALIAAGEAYAATPDQIARAAHFIFPIPEA